MAAGSLVGHARADQLAGAGPSAAHGLRSQEAEPLAALPGRSGEPLAKLLPEAYAWSARPAGERSTCGTSTFRSSAGSRCSIARSSRCRPRGKDAHRHAFDVLARLDGQGLPPGHGQRLPGPADADWMRPIYSMLGMTVGVIQTQQSQPDRRKAYACDVTYGTSKEFGFDFLRDRLLLRRIREGQTDILGGMLGHAAKPRARSRCSARPIRPGRRGRQHPHRRSRTPLIISALPTEEERLPSSATAGLHGDRPVRRGRRLRVRPREEEGRADPRWRQKVASSSSPPRWTRSGCSTLPVHRAGDQVEREFYLDRQYVVRDGEIVIVDEFTGRMSEGRKWRDGIHQAVEAKQGSR